MDCNRRSNDPNRVHCVNAEKAIVVVVADGAVKMSPDVAAGDGGEGVDDVAVADADGDDGGVDGTGEW